MRVVFTCGRFNPVTVGHEGLVREMERVAGPEGRVEIFTTASFDAKRNPLPPSTKLDFLARAFPGHRCRIGADAFAAGRVLAEGGATEAVLVLGADRSRIAADFLRYAADLGLPAAQVVLVDRPEEAASATQARALAAAGDYAAFARLMPTRADGAEDLARDIYRALRSGSGD
jgi:hypothetical protein